MAYSQPHRQPSDNRQLAMAAVTAGNGSCECMQWQAKAAVATATARGGESNCDGWQQRAEAAAKTGDGLFREGG